MMKSFVFTALSLGLLLGVTSCSSLNPLNSVSGDYKGYKNAPYVVWGKKYYPLSVDKALTYKASGICSWYDESKFGGLVRGNTAIGEKVMPWDLIAAHKTLPLPCKVRVTNLSNGRSVVVRVNDRGPFIEGRLFDVSPRVAELLDFTHKGLTDVNIEVLSVGDGIYKRKAK